MEFFSRELCVFNDFKIHNYLQGRIKEMIENSKNKSKISLQIFIY